MSIYETIKPLIVQQFKNSENFNKVLQILAAQIDDIITTSEQIKTLWDIDKSVGKQLDLIGDLLGLQRQGYNDEEYRFFLKVQILENASSGLVEELKSFLKFMTEATRVVYYPYPLAAYTIYSDGAKIIDNISQRMKNATAAGIGVDVYLSAGFRPIVFPHIIDLQSFSRWIDDSGNTIVDNLNNNIIISDDRLESQVVLAFENGDIISNEDGSIIADQSFLLREALDQPKINTYQLYNGTTLNMIDLNNNIVGDGRLVILG